MRWPPRPSPNGKLRVVRPNHVTPRVGHLERSVSCYELLGVTQIVAADGYARLLCPQGDVTLSLEDRGEALEHNSTSRGRSPRIRADGR
jgi:hypothetical protein